jgi:hypothetical protein
MEKQPYSVAYAVFKLAQKFNMDIFQDSWTSLYPIKQSIIFDLYYYKMTKLPSVIMNY